MGSNGGRSGPQWDAACATVYNQARRTGNTNCGLCGQPVDLRLPYRNPTTGHVNRRSKSVDHITPLEHDGRLLDPRNLQLAHLECQWKQGGVIRGHQAKERARRPGRRSRRKAGTTQGRRQDSRRINSRDW